MPPASTWRISYRPAGRETRPELHDGIGNAYISASMCHLGNISYRVGRKLTLEAGPKFTGDAEANKLLTRDYRKPYVV